MSFSQPPILAAFALLIVCSRADDVLAQPRDPAREAFEQGVAAMEGGRAHDALGFFVTSLRLAPYPVVRYNLGLCLRSLGRTSDAIDAFERYLAAPEPDADPALLATVRAEVSRLRSLLAVLRVTVSPASARVTVDGRAPDRALTDLILVPGVHAIEVAAPGYRTDRRELALEQGVATELRVELNIPSRLTVTPSVSEAIVSIDGRLEGIGPTSAALEPGPHAVEVRATGYETYRRTVIALETGALRLDPALRAVEAPGARGWVLPVAIGGAVLVVGAVVTAVLLGQPRDPVQGRWGTVSQ